MARDIVIIPDSGLINFFPSVGTGGATISSAIQYESGGAINWYNNSGNLNLAPNPNKIGIGTSGELAAKVEIYSSQNDLLRVNGGNGNVFGVQNSLSESLLSVNNSSGLPVFEIFPDDKVKAGEYGLNDFIIKNNNVGIGTGNPDRFKLQVAGSIGPESDANCNLGSTTYKWRTGFFSETINLQSLSASSFAFIDADKNLTTDGTGIVLGVANGGTGATSFAQNSIIFAGGGGVLTEDSSSFQYDSTNKSIGIGITAAASINAYLVRGGAKTVDEYSINITNVSTSSTGSVNKYGLYVVSAGTWNGASAGNYGLYLASITGGTSNYSIFNAANSDIYLGANRVSLLDSTPTTGELFLIGGAAIPASVSATTAYGLIVYPTWTTTQTVAAYSGAFQIVTPNSSYTLTSAYGVGILAPSKGASNTITNSYGLSIANQGISGTTTSYGLSVAAQSGSTNNYAIHTAGTADMVYFGGKVGIGISGNTTYQLHNRKITETGLTSDVTLTNIDNATLSFDATAAVRNYYAMAIGATATRSAGGNDVSNYALSVSASGAQNNYAIYAAQGSIYVGDMTANRVVFPNSSKILTGSSDFTWTDATKILTLTGSALASTRLSVTSSGAVTADSYNVSLSNATTSSTSSITKHGLNVDVSGTWNGASAVTYSGKFTNSSSASECIGISSDVSGSGARNVAGLFNATGSSHNIGLRVDGGDAILAKSISTSANEGFAWIGSCSGTPTGTPNGNYTGLASIAIIFDVLNQKLYVYDPGTPGWFAIN